MEVAAVEVAGTEIAAQGEQWEEYEQTEVIEYRADSVGDIAAHTIITKKRRYKGETRSEHTNTHREQETHAEGGFLASTSKESERSAEPRGCNVWAWVLLAAIAILTYRIKWTKRG